MMQSYLMINILFYVIEVIKSRFLNEGTTLVSHDSEATIDVGKCNDSGCYSRVIKYADGATKRQLTALVDISASCGQSIRVS